MLASQLDGWGPGRGPALCCLPLRTHSPIRPCLQLYAGCTQMAPLHQRIWYRIITLVCRFLLGLLSGLSSWPLPHYPKYTGSSLSPLCRAFSASLLPTQQVSRMTPSQWLTTLSGMGYLGIALVPQGILWRILWSSTCISCYFSQVGFESAS